MLVFAYVCIMIGTLLILLGFSNRKRKPTKGEKTTKGIVEDFEIINFKKYRAIIKSGLKKYTIESASMPWLNIGEEITFQMTGKQKVLGNDRLNNKSKIEIFMGIVIIIFPIVLFFAK